MFNIRWWSFSTIQYRIQIRRDTTSPIRCPATMDAAYRNHHATGLNKMCDDIGHTAAAAWVFVGPNGVPPPRGWDRPPGAPWAPVLLILYYLNYQKISSIPITQDFRGKNRKFKWMIISWHLIGAITPTSILIFIALFDCGLQKLDYMDLVQVL